MLLESDSTVECIFFNNLLMSYKDIHPVCTHTQAVCRGNLSELDTQDCTQLEPTPNPHIILPFSATPLFGCSCFLLLAASLILSFLFWPYPSSCQWRHLNCKLKARPRSHAALNSVDSLLLKAVAKHPAYSSQSWVLLLNCVRAIWLTICHFPMVNYLFDDPGQMIKEIWGGSDYIS